MRISAFISLIISVYMLIYGAMQLFIIDPQEASHTYYFTNIRFVYVIMSLVLTFLVVMVVAGYIKSGRSITEMFGKKGKKSRKGVTIQPPGKRAFEIFMLCSLIFSALGTFKHDAVSYGVGVLLFLLPVFLDPYISGREQIPPSASPRSTINWEMIAALIAFFTLIWSLLVHYGIIP